MTTNDFLTFLLCSYAIGWSINGLFAIKNRMLDLCQFVQLFLIAPFVFGLIIPMLVTIYLVAKVLIPHWQIILLAATCIIGTADIAFFICRYAVVPAVKRAYGVAKPFSEKICIVLHRKKL